MGCSPRNPKRREMNEDREEDEGTGFKDFWRAYNLARGILGGGGTSRARASRWANSSAIVVFRFAADSL